MNYQQSTLFQLSDVFKTARERFGVWPLTVWNCDHTNPFYKAMREEIGDDGQARDECFTKESHDRSVYRGKVTESIFNPHVAIWLLNCFAPVEGLCFDPFGGGGTRAICAAKHGLSYIGIELRIEEVNATVARCKRNGVFDRVKILEGDARNSLKLIGFNKADFLLTCPPYWNLEVYKGGSADLSMIPTYIEFLEELEKIVTDSYHILKPQTKSCWVVGLHRDKRGKLLALNHDVAKIHERAGFILREEIILNHINTGAIQRVGNFDKGNRWLVRTHEYALVFQKPG